MAALGVDHPAATIRERVEKLALERSALQAECAQLHRGNLAAVASKRSQADCLDSAALHEVFPPLKAALLVYKKSVQQTATRLEELTHAHVDKRVAPGLAAYDTRRRVDCA